MTRISDERAVHEDVSNGVGAGKVLFPGGVLQQLFLRDNLMFLLVFPSHIVEERELLSQNPNPKKAILPRRC